MEELSYVLTKNFVACVPVRFYFFHTAHFHLAGRCNFLFSHRCYEIFMFLFQENSSPLFSITRSSSFYVINVSVNIKNNVEKYLIYIGVSVLRTDGRSGGRTVTWQPKFLGNDNEIFLPMVLRARESSAISEVGAAHWFKLIKF